MCGVLYASSSGYEKFQSALMTLEHRGPDHNAILALDDREFIGHTRLSLFDLSMSSNQPVKAQGAIFSFNGEIFNFKDFGDYVSDTLFLKDLIENKSIESFLAELNSLNGFFTIIIKSENTVYAVRDRFGEKPCYIYLCDKSFSISSEIKAFHELYDVEISHKNLVRFTKDPFLFSSCDKYKNLYETVYKNVYELRPGCVAEFDRSTSELKVYEWYDLGADIVKYRNYETESLFQDSVALRQKSDARGCYSLSGGIDSTLISTYSKDGDDFFSIISDSADYSEEENIDFISENLNLKVTKIYEKDELKKSNIDEILRILSLFDYPYFDPNFVQNRLYKKMREQGFKYTLDGHGADELFCGYQAHIPHLCISAACEFDFNSCFSMMSYFLKSFPENFSLTFKLLLFCKGIIKSLKSKRSTYFNAKSSFFTDFRYREMFGQVLLRLQNNYDISSMRNSIEVRSPFLDYRLVANILSKPNSFFYGSTNKSFLRSILYDKNKIKISNKKIGLRSYVWQSLSKEDLVTFFNWYHSECINFPEFYIKKVNANNINQLTPREEHRLWKGISAKLLISKSY